jgi:hypothetical protein
MLAPAVVGKRAYNVEKDNLNCRASVNFLLPYQEDQPN